MPPKSGETMKNKENAGTTGAGAKAKTMPGTEKKKDGEGPGKFSADIRNKISSGLNDYKAKIA